MTVQQTIQFLTIFGLTILNANSSAQSVDSTFYELICKEWKLETYEENGIKFDPSPTQKDDRMIFYKDHRVKSVENNSIQNGNWEYSPKEKSLRVVDNDTKQSMILKVIKLTTTECVLEYSSYGSTLKMYMQPTK